MQSAAPASFAAPLRPPPPLARAVALGLAVGALAAAAAAYAPLPRSLLIAVVLGLGAAAIVFAAPAMAAALLGASIPELQDVTGGHLGLHVAASDVVLVLVGARILADAVARRGAGAWRALAPIRAPALLYAWMIAILLVLHFAPGSAAKSVQRLELYLLPLLVGAYVAIRGDHMRTLRAYVVASTLLALAWPALHSSGLAAQFQKNPTGQMIAGAILLLVAVRGLRRLLPCLPLLVLGLALTASRGAVLSLLVGVLVLSMALAGRSRRVLLGRMLLIVATGVLVFQWLPSSVTARLENFSSATGTAGAYAIDIRGDYARDAEALIAAHPWTGLGVGNYLAGSPTLGTQTTDPHDVILLEAAEGGYLFAAGFIVLGLGTAWALWRRRRYELAPIAAAIVLATVAHGLVDVYWVRGTPVLGWMLAGMACGVAARRRAELAR